MENQNAQVIAYKNEEYFKSSKVITPLDSLYGQKKRFPKHIVKMFEEFKREFTYESLNNDEVSIHYTVIDDSVTRLCDGFKSITIEIRNHLLSGESQGQSVSTSQLKRIQECIPNGYVLQHIETRMYYPDVFDRWFGRVPKPKLTTKITYYKHNKKRSVE